MDAAEENHGGEGQYQAELSCCAPDCEDGGLSELEGTAARPTEPMEEEPEAGSKRLSRTISCSVRDTDTVEGVGVEAQGTEEDVCP